MQLSHNQFNKTSSTKELLLLCDHIQSPANMGSLFRLADAFGVKEIVFYGTSPQLHSGRFKSTARSTERSVRFRESKNIIQELADFKMNGYTSLALEITSKSQPIQRLETDLKKFVLIVGNERHGISASILDAVDHHVHINMFGKNSSMNVSQAAAIAFYELTRH